MTDSMHALLQQAAPVLPVVVIEEAAHALPLATALHEGGISVIEITLRTPAALDAIRQIRRELPQVQVGAGTLTSARQLLAIVEAGARFAVSPGFAPALAAALQDAGLPWLPGVQTPSEVMLALDAGYSCLKLFPASLTQLDCLAGPFPHVKFCPTGGIHDGNLQQFLQRGNVLCCGGSWLVPPALQAARDWTAIRTLAQQAVALARGERTC